MPRKAVLRFFPLRGGYRRARDLIGGSRDFAHSLKDFDMSRVVLVLTILALVPLNAYAKAGGGGGSKGHSAKPNATHHCAHHHKCT
jgi:hypothetical protein